MIQKKSHIVLSDQEDLDEKTKQQVKNLSCQFVGRVKIAEMLNVPIHKVNRVIDENRYRVQVGRELSASATAQDLILSMRDLLADTFDSRNAARDIDKSGLECLAWTQEARKQMEALFKLCGSPSPDASNEGDDEFRIFKAMLNQLEVQEEIKQSGAEIDEN